ncbi:glycoside hydrolase family 3 protein [Candidatus Poriferisocius sp.]|uniref:glycoside hydrolase family 3 protein n=1 Tax=Candidatus Poriferisocius sp. TaxID=3101276 RepID=UPI003B5C272F
MVFAYQVARPRTNKCATTSGRVAWGKLTLGALLLGATLLLAAACGSSDGPEPASAPPAPTATAEPTAPEPPATAPATPEPTPEPTPAPPTDEPHEPTPAEAAARALSLEDAVGQLLLIGFRGPQLDATTAAELDRIKPGGVILFDYDVPSGGEQPRNIVSPEQLRGLIADLQSQAAIPYFVAVDAEGGFVNRLKERYGFTAVVPSAQTLGQGPVGDTAAAAEALAVQLDDLGINWNLAPVVDVNVHPESPAIGAYERSFSADPIVVVEHAEAFVGALQERRVIPTLKHFPGHGSAVGDTHLGVTDVTDSYAREEELAPYRMMIDGGYDDVVMTAHIVNRNLDASASPATLSSAIMTGLLRDELGFAGVVVSDDMQMGAIVERYRLDQAVIAAVAAGVDVILIANQTGDYDLSQVEAVKQALLDAVASGAISAERVYESVVRIMDLKLEYGIIPSGPS